MSNVTPGQRRLTAMLAATETTRVEIDLTSDGERELTATELLAGALAEALAAKSGGLVIGPDVDMAALRRSAMLAEEEDAWADVRHNLTHVVTFGSAVAA